MSESNYYDRILKIVGKQAHKTTATDRLELSTFLLHGIRKTKQLYQLFRTRLTIQAVMHKDQVAGQIYNKLEEIEVALENFARQHPINSSLRPLAIEYIKRCRVIVEQEEDAHEANRLVEEQFARLLARQKKKRPRRKIAKLCRPGGNHV